MRIALLAALALVLQRLLGLPGMPSPLAAVFVPAAVPVGLALLRHGGTGFWHGVALGLAWDVVMGPVIGPGAIAWSAAALATAALAVVAADRSPAVWALEGLVAAGVVLVVRHLALWPLGLSETLGGFRLFWSLTLTAAWCGLVGLIIRADLLQRWRTLRARRLR